MPRGQRHLCPTADGTQHWPQDNPGSVSGHGWHTEASCRARKALSGTWVAGPLTWGVFWCIYECLWFPGPGTGWRTATSRSPFLSHTCPQHTVPLQKQHYRKSRRVWNTLLPFWWVISNFNCENKMLGVPAAHALGLPGGREAQGHCAVGLSCPQLLLAGLTRGTNS